MKSLVNFIQEEQNKYVLPIGMFSCCESPYKELERRNEWLDWFFEGIECPDNVIEAAKDYNNDPILEMLNTHSIDKFIEKIKSIYNDIDIHRVYGTDDTKLNIKDEPKDRFYIVKKTKEELDKINNDDKFINILEFFNYYISETQYNKKYDVWLTLYEPRYSKKIKDFTKRNNGIAYHITTKEKYEKIKKEGLKVKGNSKYRYFPSRIYLILPNVNSSKEKDEIILNTIDKLNKKMIMLYCKYLYGI